MGSFQFLQGEGVAPRVRCVPFAMACSERGLLLATSDAMGCPAKHCQAREVLLHTHLDWQGMQLNRCQHDA